VLSVDMHRKSIKSNVLYLIAHSYLFYCQDVRKLALGDQIAAIAVLMAKSS
jgi:predicted acyltransferase